MKWTMLALPVLAALNTTDSQWSTAKRSTLVTMKNITTAQLMEHKALLERALNGEFGYTIDDIVNRFGLSPDVAKSIPPIDPVALQKSISDVKGLLGSFDIGSFKGYHGEFPEWLLDLLKKVPNVQLIEDDMRMSLSEDVSAYISDDGLISKKFEVNIQGKPTWGLDRISRRDGPAAGRFVYPANPGKDVDIYIVDSGVLVEHQEFGKRASTGAIFTADNDSKDFRGFNRINLDHGTVAAGIAAGSTYGVAKSANIISVKILDKNGECSSSDLVTALDWVASNVQRTGRRSVVNISIAGNSTKEAVVQAVQAVYNLNIPVVAAAGNYESDACQSSPQNSDYVLTVGASDENDSRVSFSNYGKCVDIFAPGDNISSASSRGVNIKVSQTKGTSFSSPFVAGQIAVLLALYPDMPVSQVYATVLQGSTSGILKDLKENDPNRLLFTGMPNIAFGGGPNGDNFGFMGDGWKLVRQMFFSLFV